MSCHITGVSFHPEEYPTREHYPFSLPLFNETKQLVFDSPVTLFAGENGTGKSTLLEALARACDIHIWGKSDGARFEYNRYENQLFKYISVSWSKGRVPGSYFGSEIFKDFRRIVDEWAVTDPAQLSLFGGKSLVSQSHGQSTMAYFRSRYHLQGIYFLDEPETALSPQSQLELLKIINNNCQDGHAQFIIATHSPILLSIKGAKIYNFNDVPVNEINYEETDHYKIYRSFFLQKNP